MTISDSRRRALRPEAVLCPDSLERHLLDAAVPSGEDAAERLGYVPVLGRRGELPDDLRPAALGAEAAVGAVPVEAIDEIDAEAVAGWIAGRYTAARYPAVLLGSPHGSAVHLAAALGAPWLPTTFTVRVPWPGGSVGNWAWAADWGAVVADRILAGNPGLSIRQVHDPILDGPRCATTVTLHLQWRQLPAAYEKLLRTRLQPGGTSLMVRDVRTWPVIELSPGHTMQVGSPVTGLSSEDYRADRPALRRILQDLDVDYWRRPTREAPLRYAERSGEPGLEPQLRKLAAESGHRARRLLYRDPATLSACVADAYREHLRLTTGRGDDCLIETGRLLDPRGVLERGLVPYWCESAAERTVAGAEWWLAGSRPFDRLAVLPEPPGTAGPAHAHPRQWRALAAFGGPGGTVDRLAVGRYPRRPLSRGHAVRVATELADSGPATPAMTTGQVVMSLQRQGARLGMFLG